MRQSLLAWRTRWLVVLLVNVDDVVTAKLAWVMLTLWSNNYSVKMFFVYYGNKCIQLYIMASHRCLNRPGDSIHYLGRHSPRKRATNELPTEQVKRIVLLNTLKVYRNILVSQFENRYRC